MARKDKRNVFVTLNQKKTLKPTLQKVGFFMYKSQLLQTIKVRFKFYIKNKFTNV